MAAPPCGCGENAQKVEVIGVPLAFTLAAHRQESDFSDGHKLGMPCIAEQGMIVIPQVTHAAISAAISHLVASDFFAGFARTAQSASRNGISVDAEMAASSVLT